MVIFLINNQAKQEQKETSSPTLQVAEAETSIVNLPPDSGHFQTASANEESSFIFQHFFGKQKQFRNFMQQGEPVYHYNTFKIKVFRWQMKVIWVLGLLLSIFLTKSLSILSKSSVILLLMTINFQMYQIKN